MKMRLVDHAASTAWKAGAAYLYVIQLSPAQLAWEYLRRHLGYRVVAGKQEESPRRWGLEWFENPELDSRKVDPQWIESGSSIALTRVADPSADCFDLWRFTGLKRLDSQGEGIALSIRHPDRTSRVFLGDTLKAGDPFGYVLPSSPQFSRVHLSILEIAAGYANGSVPMGRPATKQRPSRSALLHMRALQALDAVSFGASHRDIAEVLFGSAHVEVCWSAESELRAQVRYLIKRAQFLRDGGYLELLKGTPIRGRRELPPNRFSVSTPSGLV